MIGKIKWVYIVWLSELMVISLNSIDSFQGLISKIRNDSKNCAVVKMLSD